MIIDLTRLKNKIDKEIVVNEIYSFSEDDLSGSGVTSIDDVSINGTITLNAIDDIVLSLDIDGVMVIPCAITLKPVDYPFSISLDGDLGEICDEISEKDINSQNLLDILPIIWENILMEIPMRIVSEDAEKVTLSGEGWKLITEDEESKNSGLSNLNDLL